MLIYDKVLRTLATIEAQWEIENNQHKNFDRKNLHSEVPIWQVFCLF